MAGWGD